MGAGRNQARNRPQLAVREFRDEELLGEREKSGQKWGGGSGRAGSQGVLYIRHLAQFLVLDICLTSISSLPVQGVQEGMPIFKSLGIGQQTNSGLSYRCSRLLFSEGQQGAEQAVDIWAYIYNRRGKSQQAAFIWKWGEQTRGLKKTPLHDL